MSMNNIKKLLSFFENICENPKRELEKAASEGRKCIGIFPYFCPEELVYAAGMLPMGIWGRDMQTSESRSYFPSFICSLLHTALEMGIRGELNGLSAVMIPICCDSLKSMGANWEHGVKNIPVINAAYAENRKMQAGVDFTYASFQKIRSELQKISGREISDKDIAESIGIYNENRRALSAFSAAAAKRPHIISPAERCAVIKAARFTDRAEHTKKLRELTEALENTENQRYDGFGVVTTGIIADAPDFLKILEDNRIFIAEDQVSCEAGDFDFLTPVTDDPVYGMALRLGEIEGSSVLFDPEKKRAEILAEKVRRHNADGVIWLMTKFCDPEEFDYVPVKRRLENEGINVLMLETDRQMSDYGQARSAVEAFRERLEAHRH